jgi:CubicO group peptidase (beta-lactamase class C family)
MVFVSLPVALLALTLWGTAARAQPAEPVFSDTGPDASTYGADRGYPVPSPGTYPPSQENLIGWHTRYDRFRQTRAVPRGEGPASPLRRAEREVDVVYPYDGRYRRLADYLERHPVTGLLIARGDTVLFEHYRYGRRDDDRFLSQSMAKTVVGLLVGVALHEGAIQSLDDRADAYVPELAGAAYGATPIRALLRMSSGVAFRETYEADDDVAKLSRRLWLGAVSALRMFDTRVAMPGERFAYSSAETEVLGLIVTRATGVPLAEYLSTRIWRKLGVEADAAWAVDGSGQELAFCCLVARLRDWARLGLMLAHDGVWNGEQIVPREWVREMTASPGGDGPLGYGYQVWLLPGERRMFALLGIHGQAILVDPASGLVMVQTAVQVRPSRDPASLEGSALWYALVAQHGRP